MLAPSILVATLASLIAVGNAAPVAHPEKRGTEGRQIKWRQDDGSDLCLQVNNGVLVNGQSVGVNECFTDNLSFHPFQQWVYNAGSTKIRLASKGVQGTEYCLDFGSNLGANGQYLKIWECIEGNTAQQLYITEDNHIAVENGPGQCADIRAESGPEPAKPYGVRKQVQTWDCTFGNTNQIFAFDGVTPSPAPEPKPEPVPKPTVPGGRPITWVGEDGNQLCLQVNPEPYGLGNGRGVGISGCVPDNYEYVRFQRWTYTRGSTQIRVATPDDKGVEYCIDFGAELGNGQGLKIQQCNDNAAAQKLYITDDNHIAVENGPGQCADVRAESQARPVKPYGILKDVQSWDCLSGNTNQIFGFAV